MNLPLKPMCLVRKGAGSSGIPADLLFKQMLKGFKRIKTIMQNLRKALIASVGAITILSTSMFMVPMQVGAAAQPGSLIKMAGLSSVYYLGSDSKRYVFPNEATYFSWYSGFSKVVTVSQSELESYPLGKNVTMRPGTKLVKITTNPSVYAVTPGGTLVKVPDEATAKTLWGANWAKRVVDVPDAFFTNYTVSSANVSATAYPAGSLIKYASGADVYYIGSDGKAQKITSESAFLANGFNWNDVVTAPTAVTLPAIGTDIAAAVSTITDTSAGAGGVAYTGGTGLTVALSGDTASSRNVPSYSTLVPFVTVNLTASSDGAITVDNLIFTRKGTGAAADFDGGYLYSGDSILSTKRSVNTNDNTITFTFTALGLTIPAGATKAVTLKMNAKTTGTVTGNHYFELASASAISTMGGATVSGSFPISGNQMSYAAVNAATVTLTGGNNDSSQKVGGTGVNMGTFTIGNDNYEEVNVYRVRLRQNSDAADGAVTNFSLDLDGTIVKTGVAMSGKYVDFVLDTPFTLKKNTTITATVRGDVVSDIGKHVQLYLKNSSDFEARGSAYGNFYSAYVNNGSFDASAAADDAGYITIQGSEINVSTDGPAATNVKNNTKQVPLLNVHISSTNTDVLFDDLRFTMTNNSTVGTYNMQNIVLVDSGNNASYSVTDLTSSSTDAKTLDFENVYLKKGVQYNFVLKGDIQDNTPAGATFVAALSLVGTPGSVAHFQDADQTLVGTTDYSTNGLNGKTMTVAAPAVVVSYVSTNAVSTVQGAQGVLLYKGQFTANDVSNLTMTQMKINAQVGHDSAQNISKDWQRIYLYKVNSDGSETKLDDENSLDATFVSFSGFNLSIPHGLSNGIYFTVRGDVKNSPSGTTTRITPSTTYSEYNVKDGDSKALVAAQYSLSGASQGPITTVVTQGTYTLGMDTTEAGVNNNQNVLAGQIVKAGRIKVTAANEGAILKDIVIKNGGDATNVTAARAYIYSDSGMTTLLGSADFGYYGSNDYRALVQGLNNGNGVSIPTSGTTYLYVGVLVKGIDYSASPSADSTAVAGKTIIISVPADVTGSYETKVWGQASGQLETNPTFTGTGKTSTVLGAVMSGITSDFANGLLANGTAKDIFSFKVTAPASSNVDYDGQPLGIKLATTTFSVASSTNIGLATFLVERVGGANGEKAAKHSGTTATAMAAGGVFVINFGDTYGATDPDLIIKPGQTATYVVRATITGVTTAYSLQTTIESLSSNASYTHHTGSAGSQLSDLEGVYPLLSGVTSVRGGTLSN